MPGVKVIIRNNAGDIVELARYLDRGGWEVVQRAEEGSVGMSTIYMDDLDESIWDSLGLDDGARRQIRLVDIDTNKIVQFGYTGRRMIKRRYDRTGTYVGRAWSIEIWDPNTVINRRVLTHHGAKRPRETDVQRIQWLIAAVEWDIVGQFIIGTTSTKMMSKADYRGQMVNEVISDCSQQANKNYWLDIVDDGAGDRLTFWYGKDNRNYYLSDVSISNDIADIDLAAVNGETTTDVYLASRETEYQMDPSRLYTGVAVQWEKGLVYRHSITGATQFERWDTVMQAPNIHEKDRAAERAENMLERLVDQGEDVRIESGILVPAVDVHRVRAGMRIPVKLTHIPTMVDYVDCRILSRGLLPRADGRMYWMPLTLEPIGPGSAALTCSTAVSGATTAETTDGTPAGTVSISITPPAGEDSVVIGGVIACHGHNDDIASSGGWTDVYAANYPISTHPEFLSTYKAVPSATGDTTLDATYTPDSGTWGAVLAAIRTSATAPIQTKSTSNTINTTVNLDSATDPASMMIMVCAIRDDASIEFADTLPPDFWTQRIIQATSREGISQDVIAIFTACPGESIGTGIDVGKAGGGHVTVMEWEIS